MYVIMFSPPQLLPDSPTSLPIQLYVFLSPFCKETSPKLKIKTNTHKPNMVKHAKTKQNETKSMEFLLWLANYFCPVGLPWRVVGTLVQ